MAVAVVFASGDRPLDYVVWKAIAEAVLGTRNACVLARLAADGWHVVIQDFDYARPSTLMHPHEDGDFERELRRALFAAGVRVAGISDGA
jgi:hypothetical protein